MNLASVIDGADPGDDAVIAPGIRWTYADLAERAGAVRSALAAAGVGPGEPVALVAGITPSFVSGYLGILGAGAVAAPLNPLAPAPELEREIAAIRASAVVVGEGGTDAFASLSPPAATLPAIHAEQLATRTDPVAVVERDDADLAVLLFTSGTAGAPKAAMLTHGNLRWNQRQVLAHLDGLVTRADTALCSLPLFHVLALNSLVGVVLAVGGSVVLQPRFDARATLAAVDAHSVTVLAGAPPMWTTLAELNDADLEPLRRIRVAISGAAALRADVAERFRALGVPLAQGYGLTEAAPSLCLATGTDAPLTSVGPPLPGVELRLVDESGDDVAIDDVGEIWAKGPNIFTGYWDDDGATKRALTADGWLRTGDLGVVDGRGYVSIVDRLKDLIIISGFNVYPQEVEDVLLAHPGVAGASVTGVAEERTGEAVHAAVVLRPPGAATVDELIGHCRAQLARYKCPTTIDIVEELPTTATGKVLRRSIEDSVLRRSIEDSVLRRSEN